MTYPDVPLDVLIEAAPGADVITDEPDDWPWQDITSSWHVPDGISVSDGRSEGSVQAEPSNLGLALKNNDGQWTPDDPRSIHWPGWDVGCPMRVSVDAGAGMQVLPGSSTFVDSIDPAWPGGSSKHATVRVTGKGLLGFLGRGKDPLGSAPKRRITHPSGSGGTGTLLAAWTLEDGVLADLGKPLFGAEPMRPFVGVHPSTSVITMPQWGQGNLAPWLPPVVSRSGSAGLTVLWAPVAWFQVGSPSGWSIEWMYNSGLDAGESTMDVNPSYLGGPVGVGWPQVMLDPANQRLLVAMNGEPEIDADTPTLFDGKPHHILWTIEQFGAKVSWVVYVDGVATNLGVTSGNMTVPVIETIGMAADAEGGAQLAQGYVMVWGNGAPNVADAAAAAFGWTGEAAARRLLRLGEEQRVRVTVVGDPDDSEPMGPQEPKLFVDLIRECEAADRGVLAEADFGLWFLPRVARYNPATAFTIDAGARELHRSFAPKRDLQRVRNEWTISRPNGGEATVADTAHQARRGRLADSEEINVASDQVLGPHAGWRVLEGTAPGLRHPELAISLHVSPDLVAPWLAAQLGDVAAAVNLMPQYPPGGLRQILEGRSQQLTRRSWMAQMRVSPASPWSVFVLDDQVLGRLETSGSELASGFVAGTDVSMSVAVTDGPLWSPANTDAPFDILVAGVRLTVRAVGQVISTNPWLETNATGWTFSAGSTVAHSTAQAHEGTGSLLITPDGVTATTGAIQAAGSAAVTTPAADYRLSGWLRASAAISDARMAVDWYQSDGTTFVSSSLPTAIALSAGVWTPHSAVVTAPALGARARLRVRLAGTPTGTVHADELLLIPTSTYTSSPQTFTVAVTPVNGIEKSISSGEPVTTAGLGVLAL